MGKSCKKSICNICKFVNFVNYGNPIKYQILAQELEKRDVREDFLNQNYLKN